MANDEIDTTDGAITGLLPSGQAVAVGEKPPPPDEPEDDDLQPPRDTKPPAVQFNESQTIISIMTGWPAEAFTLWHYAVMNNINDDKDPMSFMWRYAQIGFMAKHKLALTLSPIAPSGGSGDNKKDIEQLRSSIELTNKSLIDLAGTVNQVAKTVNQLSKNQSKKK